MRSADLTIDTDYALNLYGPMGRGAPFLGSERLVRATTIGEPTYGKVLMRFSDGQEAWVDVPRVWGLWSDHEKILTFDRERQDEDYRRESAARDRICEALGEDVGRFEHMLTDRMVTKMTLANLAEVVEAAHQAGRRAYRDDVS